MLAALKSFGGCRLGWPPFRRRFKETPPLLCFVLLFLSLICIMFQILIAQSTLSRRSALFVRYSGKWQLKEDQVAYDTRTVKVLNLLDAELRELVYQDVESVESFSKAKLDYYKRLHSKIGYSRMSVNKSFNVCDHGLANPTLKLNSMNSSILTFQPSAHQPNNGGSFIPLDCVPNKSVVVIIPYRNRLEHLTTLLQYLHPLMQLQKLKYRIVVAEQMVGSLLQFGNATFNKGKLMNAGFLESLKMEMFDCVVFHDVDMLPEDVRIPYYCPTYPRHISAAVDKWNYSLLYKDLIGGVLAFTVPHFFKVNGYSNMFWGWGAEDDDMAVRIKSSNLLVTRANPLIAKFSMIKHPAREASLEPARFKLLYLSAKRYRLDGLNNLKYQVISIRELPLYTHIVVDVGQPPPSVKHYYSIT